MKNIIIRDYSVKDFEQINILWEETDLGGAIRGDNQQVIENTIKHDGKFLILENTETKEIIGTSWITNDYRRLYLHHFGIKPKYQGNGYGNLLAIASLDYAKKKNMQIKIEVHKNNIGAIKLYEKYGFKYLGDYLVYIIRKF